MPLFFAAEFAAASMSGETPAAAAQTGLGIMMFGVFVRTVLVWHITGGEFGDPFVGLPELRN